MNLTTVDHCLLTFRVITLPSSVWESFIRQHLRQRAASYKNRQLKNHSHRPLGWERKEKEKESKGKKGH